MQVTPSLPFASFLWLPAVLGIPWGGDLSLQSLVPLAHGILLFLCVSIQISLFLLRHQSWDEDSVYSSMTSP